MTDWLPDEDPCPKCGAYDVRYQHCTEFLCDDGLIDLGELDWQDYGEYETCAECGGTGVMRWCANCGWDLQTKSYMNGKPETNAP